MPPQDEDSSGETGRNCALSIDEIVECVAGENVLMLSRSLPKNSIRTGNSSAGSTGLGGFRQVNNDKLYVSLPGI